MGEVSQGWHKGLSVQCVQLDPKRTPAPTPVAYVRLECQSGPMASKGGKESVEIDGDAQALARRHRGQVVLREEPALPCARLGVASVDRALLARRHLPGARLPRPGYMLSLDFSIKEGLGRFCDELDERVLDVGGRLYLAKDSRTTPERIAAIYPPLQEWQAHRDGVDPEGVFVSDLARRPPSALLRRVEDTRETPVVRRYESAYRPS